MMSSCFLDPMVCAALCTSKPDSSPKGTQKKNQSLRIQLCRTGTLPLGALALQRIMGIGMQNFYVTLLALCLGTSDGKKCLTPGSSDSPGVSTLRLWKGLDTHLTQKHQSKPDELAEVFVNTCVL